LILFVSLPFGINASDHCSSSSSFGLGGIYTNAASRAANKLAEEERLARRRNQNHKKRKITEPRKKKTMEEGIQSAKRLPKVGGLELDDLASEDELPLTLFSEDCDDEDGDIPFEIPSTFDGYSDQMEDYNSIDELQHRRKKKKKRRRRYKQACDSNGREPQSRPTAQPTSLPTSTSESESALAEQETTAIHSSQQYPVDNSCMDSLINRVIINKFLVTERIRVGSTKSELYKCYHISDKAYQHSLIIKLSNNIDQIRLEHRIYVDLFNRLTSEQQTLFVKAYDWITPSLLTDDRAGFVMDCGVENLRGFIWRHGPFTGEILRDAMKTVIRIVDALHQLGTLWTEVKSENLIVFEDGRAIKAIDLESVAGHQEYLRAYTAETYPPEFPLESLYEAIPKIPLEYSFDIWGVGLVLLEMATGEPLFTLQKTYDVDYIKERLKDPQAIVSEATHKLQDIEDGAKNVILQCLVVDPKERSTCKQLLQDDYFK
jgi:hypothetical protein